MAKVVQWLCTEYVVQQLVAIRVPDEVLSMVNMSRLRQRQVIFIGQRQREDVFRDQEAQYRIGLGILGGTEAYLRQSAIRTSFDCWV